MQYYKNKGGDSGVRGFELGSDFIEVKFSNGGTYKYTYCTPGKSYVEEMKKLAVRGRGLNAFINKRVGKRFEKKK